MARTIPKRYFDLGLLVVITLLMAYRFVAHPSIKPVYNLSLSAGILAFVFLNLVLLIGPLAKLWTSANILLYNRRHFGVTTFFLAFIHGILQDYLYFHFNLQAILGSPNDYLSLKTFPFQVLGVLALGILFLMAVTSWDLAVKLLRFTRWKLLHMLVYVAYTAVIFHIWIGVLRFTTSTPVRVAFMGLIALVVLVHLIAASVVQWRQSQYNNHTL